jgi:hypothetical protein
VNLLYLVYTLLNRQYDAVKLRRDAPLKHVEAVWNKKLGLLRHGFLLALPSPAAATSS